MTRWDYVMLTLELGELERVLCNLGQKGWDLVAVSGDKIGLGYLYVVILKRPDGEVGPE